MSKPRTTIPVTMTADERAIIEAAAERIGLKLGPYLRMAGLERAGREAK